MQNKWFLIMFFRVKMRNPNFITTNINGLQDPLRSSISKKIYLVVAQINVLHSKECH
jgi:hypothetical protein